MGLNTTITRWITRSDRTIVYSGTNHADAFGALVAVIDRHATELDHPRGVTEALNRLEIMVNSNVEITLSIAGQPRTLSVRRAIAQPIVRTDDPFAPFDTDDYFAA